MIGYDGVCGKRPETPHGTDKKELSDLTSHLREDERKVDDLRARALFEVMAEVLTGLRKASAWR